MTGHAYDADTQVRPVAPDRYEATLTDRWGALSGTPNGGYVLAVCLQALGAEMPFPDPLVASASYLRPPSIGPAEARTEIVRRGRRVATGEARLLQDGAEAVRVVASYTDLAGAAGRTLVLGRPPDLPPPDEIAPFDGSMPGVTITERVEYRAPQPPGWMTGQPNGKPSVEFWIRFKDGREADLQTLALLVDAAAPAVLEIGAPGSITIQLTVHLRGHPAPGWLACRAATRHVIAGYHEEDFEIWDSAGTLVAQSRQLAILPG
jgi:acyl-CoA thioesterase